MPQRTAYFKNKVTLVTGGAQGIGWAIAAALAHLGARVFICDVSDKNLEVAEKRIQQESLQVQIFLTKCDVSRQEQVEAWIENVYRQTGFVHILINNAAFVRWKDYQEMSVQEEELSMKVGYDALIYTIKKVLPIMYTQKQGHIINLGSSAGSILVPGCSAAYSATKAATNFYTLFLQQDLRSTPIHVALIRPITVSGTNFFKEHVSHQRMVRSADFVPVLTAEKVAQAIVKCILKKKNVVDLPFYLKFFYALSNLMPETLFRLMSLGGSGKRTYRE